jgi:hypothetical protein
VSFCRCFAGLPQALADLLAWGRDGDGNWWGLVAWEFRVVAGSRHVAVCCSAWVPARTLRPSEYERPHYPGVPRLALPDDPTYWPGVVWPKGARTHHYGRLTTEVDGVPGQPEFVAGGR